MATYDEGWEIVDVPKSNISHEATGTAPVEMEGNPPGHLCNICASMCNNSNSVFWSGDGVIYEMHWGTHNQWRPEVLSICQPSVSRNTALTSSKKDAGGCVFWPGDGKIHELHWGEQTNWHKVLAVHSPERGCSTLGRDSLLSASMCNNSTSVFWPGDGVIYELHWGTHNNWKPEVLSICQSLVSSNTMLTSCKKDAGGSVFWPGDGTIHELHWGKHSNWHKVHTVHCPEHGGGALSQDSLLSASMCNNSNSVFWSGDGVVYEMHWGTHNNWKPEVLSMCQSLVSRNTVLTSSKKDAGGCVFWPGDGTIHELHWGQHSGWHKVLNIHRTLR